MAVTALRRCYSGNAVVCANTIGRSKRVACHSSGGMVARMAVKASRCRQSPCLRALPSSAFSHGLCCRGESTAGIRIQWTWYPSSSGRARLCRLACRGTAYGVQVWQSSRCALLPHACFGEFTASSPSVVPSEYRATRPYVRRVREEQVCARGFRVLVWLVTRQGEAGGEGGLCKGKLLLQPNPRPTGTYTGTVRCCCC